MKAFRVNGKMNLNFEFTDDIGIHGVLCFVFFWENLQA